MLPGEFEFGPMFQLRILSFLVRHPERVRGVVEPQYFGNPLHADIARVACKAYQEHPKSRLSKTALKELVKRSLTRKELRNWSLYKEEIRTIYRINALDGEIIFHQAQEFARERKYREALIEAEKAVSHGRCDARCGESFVTACSGKRIAKPARKKRMSALSESDPLLLARNGPHREHVWGTVT